MQLNQSIRIDAIKRPIKASPQKLIWIYKLLSTIEYSN